VNPEQGVRSLHRLGPEIDEVIDEVRTLSRGIYPPLLIDAGPAEALRAAALHSPVPVTVTTRGVAARHSAEVESTVYFCCLEALQNGVKHAGGATHVTIDIFEGDPLRFEVRDDGGGFEPSHNGGGSGLTNMRDRVASVGGTLTVSSNGNGTNVSASIPLAPERAP
jgi:signal transduction histidine kinase